MRNSPLPIPPHFTMTSKLAIRALLLTAFAIPQFSSAHETHGNHDGDVGQDRPKFEQAPLDSNRYVVGNERALFLWNSDWLQLPEGREWFGSTHGCMVTDSKDNVYISADAGAAVQVFSKDGKYVRSFGEDWGAGVHGLSIVQEVTEELTAIGAIVNVETEYLYIAQTSTQRVFKTTLDGKLVLELDFPSASGKYENPASYKPTSVAVAPDGTMFVADGYGLSWIHIYGKDGMYRSSFGGPGDAPSNLRTPHGLWLDTHGETPTLLVADRENHRIARFALDGTFVEGTDSKSGLLRRPCHIQFHGDLAIVADLAGRVTLLDENLKLITQLGDNPDPSQHAQFNLTPDKWKSGAFIAPHCARFDSQGNILVMDWNIAGRITRLEPLTRLASK